MRMSVNPLFGNKKRHSSVLYGVGHAPLTTSSSVYQPSSSRGRSHGDSYPPNKRYKNTTSTETPLDDPFGDNEDFTVDDLEEIDILATQALTQNVPEVHPKTTMQTVQGEKTRPNTSQKTGTSSSWNALGSTGRHVKDPVGNGTESIKGRDIFGLEVLQAQHEELKQKLKEVQGEILVKNGEIKVLRESLRQSEYDQEQQRRSHLLLEKEKAQVQSEKDKELAKKLQSLQSELQFKDAEMNEMKTRLQNCERVSKFTTHSIPSISPKKNSSETIQLESCSSSQSGKNSFPTKESFGAEMSPKSSISVAQHVNRNLFNKDDAPVHSFETKQERIHEPISYTYVQRQHTQGSILLNALMKQSMAPGSLGLYHLLSSSPETLPGIGLQHNACNSGSTGMSSIRTTCSRDGSPPLSSLREAQKLAITGLHLIAMDDGQSEKDVARNQKGPFSLPKPCKLPGAVHILPLVEHHVTMYCQALQALEKSGNGPSENQSLSSSSTAKSIASSTEDCLASLEDCTVASLGVLYYLVFYSQEVVCTLLSVSRKGVSSAGNAGTLNVDKNPACSYQYNNDTRTPRPQEAPSIDQSEHPLFKKILHLLGFSTTTPGCQRAHIVNTSLSVLVKLAENSTPELLNSFQSFLISPVLLRCLCSEAPLSAAHLTVRLLAIFVEHQRLAAQLCSCSETCVLLALFTYVTSRPDKLASERLWLLLEEEIVQFLTKMCVLCLEPPSTNVGSTCHCNREAVKALIIMLHRQWLKVRRPENSLCGFQKKAVQFLRDTLLLLHSLSQRDKTFNEHCMEVLHQYDQALPGIRAIFRTLPDLNESEELALEDLCPLEPEMDEQDMDCD